MLDTSWRSHAAPSIREREKGDLLLDFGTVVNPDLGLFAEGMLNACPGGVGEPFTVEVRGRLNVFFWGGSADLV